jgi:eukaryotic-like serine/threonine-protein kinase
MTPEQWRQVTATFHAALAREQDARAAFLDEACGDNAVVREEVERLLAAHADAGSFGDAPAVTEFADTTTSEVLARPHHPFRWVAVFAALVALVAFSIATVRLARDRGVTKEFGWEERRGRGGGAGVTAVSPGGPAAGRIEIGDRIIEMNGTPPFGGGATVFHRRALSIGDTYQVALERKGQRIDTSLTVGRGPSRLAHYLTYFSMSLVWSVVGIFIGLARPDDRVARVAFGAAVTTGVGYLITAVLEAGNFFNPVHVVLGVHFFSIFPSGRRLTGLWKWGLVLGYLIALFPVSLVWWLQTTFVLQGVAGAAALVTHHQALFASRAGIPVVVFYVALVGMVTAAAYNYRRLTDENERRRVKWVAYGSILSLTPQVVLSIAELTGSPFGLAGASLGRFADAATAGIPVAMAYAVVKHRVLDIRVVVRRGLQYLLAKGALQALVALPLIALAFTVVVNRHRTIGELMTESTGYLYWLVIAGVTLRFRQPVQLWLDRRFFREEYDREQLLLGLLDDLGKIDSISQLSGLVQAKLESALHPASMYFWYRDPGEFAEASASNPLLTPPDFPVEGRWLTWLAGRAHATELPLPSDAGLSRQQIRWFAARNVQLAIPIADSDERLAGVLLLGPKKSEEPYGANDRRLLLSIAKQVAVVRENLRLRAQVSDEQRIRHDVLAHLDRRSVNLLKECPGCGACFDGDTERCDRDGYALTLSLPVSRIIESKYRLDRLIGKGGMGAVYEAQDLRLDRVVAVKILLGRAFGQQTALRRFRREARAAARLDHPRIVRVHDYGSLEGEGAYIVMERLRGSTLRAELERLRRLAPLDAADWFDQILDGLAAAHSNGVVHRDLKPENIMGRRDEERRLSVTLLDFGLAKEPVADAATTGPMTIAGVVMGTFGYMSPEQLLGHPVDHRTDIFSLGVMLAESIAGERPFQGDTPMDVSRAVLHQTYHLPGESPGALAVDDVLQQCLAKDPSMRFASADALRQALIPALRSVVS